MNPETRRLLLRWLEEEARDDRRLSDYLHELQEKHRELAPLARYLALREQEERASQAVLDRERWFRGFSWRLIQALFAFGVVSLGIFLLWGGEEAFMGALFFVAGGATFYLVAQAMATYRSHRDQKALTRIREQFRREVDALREEVGR
ncbi:MAG: hypothetical protein ACE5HB_07730 [Terriglobia bacterium]